MYNKNGSCYIRIPFTVSGVGSLSSLKLNVRYDDGFVAYINGIEVTHKNAPGRDGNSDPLDWEADATVSHGDTAAKILEEFDVSHYIYSLHDGDNILAIHGLNKGTGSSDFLISTELLDIC